MTNKRALEFAIQERDAYKRKVEDGYVFYQKIVDYYEIVIDALEKQEPKEPLHFEQPLVVDEEIVGVWEYDCCPVCGAEVREEYDAFCNNCGKALNWSDEE